MPISVSTSEKHLSTRTAAATEDSREDLDVLVSMTSNLERVQNHVNSFPLKRTTFLMKERCWILPESPGE
jgi:hypothetical protein